jgi:hypothetical protein
MVSQVASSFQIFIFNLNALFRVHYILRLRNDSVYVIGV